MSYLSESLKKLKYDKRMLRWNLRQKILTQDEHEKHLKDLEDLSGLKAEDKEGEESSKQEPLNPEDSKPEPSGSDSSSES